MKRHVSVEEVKEALKAIIEKQKLMDYTIKNLEWWGMTWESATPFEIRRNAVDAMQFAFRLMPDSEREKYRTAEAKFIAALNKACGIKPITLKRG